MKRSILVAVTLVALLAGASGYIVMGTPSYSLYSLLLAVRERDVATAYQYIKIDSAIDTATEEAWKTVVTKMERERPSDPFGQLGHNLGMALAQTLRPIFQKGVTDMVKRGIEQTIMGIGEKDPLQGFRRMNKFQLARVAFSLPIHRTGAVATIKSREVAYLPHSLGSEGSVEMVITLQRGINRRWQIVGITPDKGWAAFVHELVSPKE